MIEVHKGSAADLLNGVIGPGREPVTLVIPYLPGQNIIDQLLISTRQHGRELRIVTSLYGHGPLATRAQIEMLLRLVKNGAKAKVGERGILPAILFSPPVTCAMLPSEWGRDRGAYQVPIIIHDECTGELKQLCDRIWKRSGARFTSRRLNLAMRWLEDIASEYTGHDDASSGMPERVDYSELTLFDKRRGSRRKKKKRERMAWWAFQGTANDRINPFLPIRIWAAGRNTHKMLRFPSGKRPTGVKTGDDIFFTVLSRVPGGDSELYIVGSARAIAYRRLIDDATDEQKIEDQWLERFPHALQLENVRFIRGVVGEGIAVYPLMKKLGPQTFASTSKNLAGKSGNTDPFKSISQKSIIKLADRCASETRGILEEKFHVLGTVTSGEISRFEPE